MNIKFLIREDQIKLLATDGMLIKRPMIIGEDFIINGFKEEEWKKVLLDDKNNGEIERKERG